MQKIIYLILICISLFGSTEIKNYTISLCKNVSYSEALKCTSFYTDTSADPLFIIQHNNGKYSTMYGIYTSVQEAKEFRFTIPKNDRDLMGELSIEPLDTDLISDPPVLSDEDRRLINANLNRLIFLKDRITVIPKKIIIQPRKQEFVNVNNNSICLSGIDTLLIDINTTNNTMYVSSIKEHVKTYLKKYKVSSAKKNILKPLGEGGVTAIVLDPFWYPTDETIDYFIERKGIYLPTIVPPKDPLNYMGAAKINLTHKVDGKEIYRIHGTLNDKTIGSKETSGCIRMKNKEVRELALLLKQFAKTNSIKKIKVILK